MNKLIDDLNCIPEEFTNRYRGVLLLRRNKDSQDGNAQRRAIKRITQNTHQWRGVIQELEYIQQTTHNSYRIYSSVNSRSIDKAIHEFKRRQLEVDWGNRCEYENFYCDIENRFFSCLMNPNVRDQNHFLIDCDSPEEHEYALGELADSGLILFDYATKNGRHLITKPFNPNDYDIMNIKKDDLMYIG